jgi:hypothetical protein
MPGGGALPAGSPVAAKRASGHQMLRKKTTKMKRRPREIHLGARKGGKGTGEADRRQGQSSGGWGIGGAGDLRHEELE